MKTGVDQDRDFVLRARSTAVYLCGEMYVVYRIFTEADTLKLHPSDGAEAGVLGPEEDLIISLYFVSCSGKR